jgi:hypothetical protein
VTLGWLLLLAGIVAIALGTRSFFAMKRAADAPFKSTGEIAEDPDVADHRGMISTQGETSADAPLVAPCSRRPCLFYDIRIDRHWTKTLETPKGPKTETFRAQIDQRWAGVRFRIDDGSGPIGVDARRGAFCELVPSHEETVPAGDASMADELVFGEIHVPRPADGEHETTTAFTAVERILPAKGTVYARGKLHDGAIVKPGWTDLFLSTRSRESILGEKRTRATLGLALGALVTSVSIPVFLASADASPPAPSEVTQRTEGPFGIHPEGDSEGPPSPPVSAPSAAPLPGGSSTEPRAAGSSPPPHPFPAAGKPDPRKRK